jgi:D-hydroxyproline dehydrogenase subunit gamma
MFRRRDDSSGESGESVTIYFENAPIICRPTDSVAAAVLLANPGHTRRTPVTAAPRAPYCMMGVCFDCLMEIDGVENRQACMTPVRDGMQVQRQNSVPALVETPPTGGASDD